MTVTALVMAGGKGTRMTLSEEKPLVRVCRKPVVELVIAALKSAKRVDSVVVAVSKNTPKTAQYLQNFSVKVLETPGNGYISDMQYAVKVLNLQTVLTIGSDLPLITGQIIDNIIEHYFESKKSALAVAVPLKTKQKLKMSLDYAFEHEGTRVVPAGINVNDGGRINDDELDQEVYVVEWVEVAVNINTAEELKTAQEQFAEISGRIN
jgi:adenosylcobinamide-phosphate guanylyltransferase